MKRFLPKPAPTRKPKNAYRWCDKYEKYIAVDVCKKRGDIKPACRRCFSRWNRSRYQLALPLNLDGTVRRKRK